MVKCIYNKLEKWSQDQLSIKSQQRGREVLKTQNLGNRPWILAQRRQLNFSEFSRAAEENKISNINHSIYKIETSWLFREELFL